jgi:hypothetical protein
MPMMKPLVVCVTRQAELARQPVSASISKEYIRYGVAGMIGSREMCGGERRQRTPPPPSPICQV